MVNALRELRELLGSFSQTAERLESISDGLAGLSQLGPTIEKALDNLGLAGPFTQAVYPRGRGLRAMPAGITDINFLDGVVARSDGTFEQLSAKLPIVRSGLLYVDSDADVNLLIKGQFMGSLGIIQGSTGYFQGVPFEHLQIAADYPLDIKVMASDAPRPVVQALGGVGFQLRLGAVNPTANSYEIVTWTPVGGGALGATLRNGTLFTGNMGMKTWIVTNDGSNSVDLNIQHLHIPDQTWVDSAATGAAYALGSGNTVLIEVGLNSTFCRLRVRNTTSGSASSITAQYRAVSIVR